METAKFKYQDVDTVGLETLNAIAEAPNLNRWMYETIRPFCKGKILEVGSGTGNISEYFLKDDYLITLSDLRQNYCDIVSEKFRDYENLGGVIKLDICGDVSKCAEQFDTIFALNVVEHIEDHERALSNMRRMLKPNGKVIVLVPAHMQLYNSFDKELMHFRRYNRESLTGLLSCTGFAVDKSFYFNSTGLLGWFVSGKVQKNTQIPSSQMRVYNKLVPLFRLIDTITLHKIGLSIVSVGIRE